MIRVYEAKNPASEFSLSGRTLYYLKWVTTFFDRGLFLFSFFSSFSKGTTLKGE